MIGNYHLDNVFFNNPLEFDDVYLIQIGRLYCKNSTVIDTHIHTDLFELTIVTGGAGTVTTNDITLSIKNGDIYISMPGDIHKIESDKCNPLKYDFLAFKLKENQYKPDLIKISEDYHSPKNRIFKNEQIGHLTANAIAELTVPGIYSNELLNSIFRQILIYIIRVLKENPNNVHPDNISNSEILCYKCMNYIDTHIYTMKNLSELCDATDYSYGYLSRLFKNTTSQKINDYYKERRINAACLLLKENKLSITEISEILGYSSLYAFSKAFKKQMNISPKEYKTNIH